MPSFSDTRVAPGSGAGALVLVLVGVTVGVYVAVGISVLDAVKVALGMGMGVSLAVGVSEAVPDGLLPMAMAVCPTRSVPAAIIAPMMIAPTASSPHPPVIQTRSGGGAGETNKAV